MMTATRSNGFQPHKVLTLLVVVLVTLASACAPSQVDGNGSAGTACGPSESAPLLPGKLLVTGNATIELWTRGRRTIIACVNNSPQYFTHPAFAPDGKSIAYVLSNAPTAGGQDWGDDIYTTNADSTGTRLIHRHETPGAQIDSLAWTPDGSGLIVGSFLVQYGEQGQTASTVFTVSRLDLSSGSTSDLIRNAAQAAVSPDGRSLSYVTYPSTDPNISEIAVADIDGRNAHPILTEQAGFQSYFAPHLSPDGKRIVFAAVGGPVSGMAEAPTGIGALGNQLGNAWAAPAAADGSPYELWVANLDGSDLHRVANLREDLPYPQWSSDGNQILFLGAAALYLASADGSSIKQIDKGVPHGQIDWYQR
jgi:Tol biopolymer transport system component